MTSAPCDIGAFARALEFAVSATPPCRPLDYAEEENPALLRPYGEASRPIRLLLDKTKSFPQNIAVTSN
jgi:hypothetical protein